MRYKLLSHLFYKNKDEYNALYQQRMSSESTYVLPIKIGDHSAFYCLCPEIYETSLRIMQLDKKVSLIEEELPNAALFQFADRCLIDEIKLTNDIEGVYSTRKELSAVLHEVSSKAKKRRFYGLLNKYQMLISDNEFPLNTSTDIREIYDGLVLKEVAEDCVENIPDGEIFRKDMAEVTTPTQKVIHKGAYPETKIIQLMEQALNILNQKEIPKLIRISIFHYLFGYIHPFYDGNGRLGRFILSYGISNTLTPLISFRISETIKENISAYYKAFSTCNDNRNLGDLTPFLLMQLKMILLAMEELEKSLNEKLIIWKKYEEVIKNQSDNFDLLRLYSFLIQAALFSEQGISMIELQQNMGFSSYKIKNLMCEIPEGMLVVKIKNKFKFYSIDLNKLNKSILEKTVETIQNAE